jgi:predicted transcriptional regulator of viral defense system
MFSKSIKKKLIKQFAIPLRQNQLEELANRIISITSHKSVRSLIRDLHYEDIIAPYELTSRNNKDITIYCSLSLEKQNPYEIAKAMYPEAYFCNLSSIYYHALTNQIPSSVYLCHETISAKRKTHKKSINNNALRSAFIKPHRYTNYVFDINWHEIVVVDRVKNSGHGVVEVHTSRTVLPDHSRVTCIERALIDAVVSPHYNGGIVSVSAYFKKASRKFSISKLVDIYKQLNFIYPYSQSIGFFLDKAGMTKNALVIYKEFPPARTFFVDHEAKTSWSYDDKWKLYYPLGLVDEN